MFTTPVLSARKAILMVSMAFLLVAGSFFVTHTTQARNAPTVASLEASCARITDSAKREVCQDIVERIAELIEELSVTTEGDTNAFQYNPCDYARVLTLTLGEGMSDPVVGSRLQESLYARGIDDTQVTTLQKFLIASDYLHVDAPTGYFGTATELAVQRWQADHDVVSSGSPETTGYGVVGSMTRTRMVEVSCTSDDEDDTTTVETERSATITSSPNAQVNRPKTFTGTAENMTRVRLTLTSPGGVSTSTIVDVISERWTRTALGTRFPVSGNYTLTVQDSTGAVLARQIVVASVTVSAPTISSVRSTATSGQIQRGSVVTIRGTGFLTTGNVVYLDGYSTTASNWYEIGSALSSYDSVTNLFIITVTIPSEYPCVTDRDGGNDCSPSQTLPRGNHTLTVGNANGISNAYQFNVVEGTSQVVCTAPNILASNGTQCINSTQCAQWSGTTCMSTGPTISCPTGFILTGTGSSAYCAVAQASSNTGGPAFYFKLSNNVGDQTDISAKVRWYRTDTGTTNAPVSCVASGDWTGTKPIPYPGDASTIREEVIQRGITTKNLTLTCVNSSGVSASHSISVGPITGFEGVTTNTTTEGPTFTFQLGNNSGDHTEDTSRVRWYLTGTSQTAPTGISCVASGDWSGTKTIYDPNGTITTFYETINRNATTPKTLTLTCTKDGRSTTKSLTIDSKASFGAETTATAATQATLTLRINGSTGPVGAVLGSLLTVEYSSTADVIKCGPDVGFTQYVEDPVLTAETSRTGYITGAFSRNMATVTSYPSTIGYKVNCVQVVQSGSTSYERAVQSNEVLVYSCPVTTHHVPGSGGTRGTCVPDTQTVNNVSPATPSINVTYIPPLDNLSGEQNICVVPVGQSTCTRTIEWTASNITSNLLFMEKVLQTAASSLTLSESRSLIIDPNTNVNRGRINIELSPLYFAKQFIIEATRQNGSINSSNLLSARCASGSAWDGSICRATGLAELVAPTCSASFSPSTVVAGNSTNVTMSTTNAVRGVYTCSDPTSRKSFGGLALNNVNGITPIRTYVPGTYNCSFSVTGATAVTTCGATLTATTNPNPIASITSLLTTTAGAETTISGVASGIASLNVKVKYGTNDFVQKTVEVDGEGVWSINYHQDGYDGISGTPLYLNGFKKGTPSITVRANLSDTVPLASATLTVNSASAFLTSPSQSSTVGLNTTTLSCINLPSNMHRGAESPLVTQLQNFLAGKGLLTTDNVTGFYGDMTIQAVKEYQGSIGLPQTGMVYDFTRSAIQRETCGW